MANTGFPPAVRAIIQERSGGMCELCGIDRATEVHHRRPRGSGGSRRDSTNTAANALALCTRCHRMAENYRHVAILMGWILGQSVDDPAEAPVLYRRRWVFLDEAGNLVEKAA